MCLAFLNPFTCLAALFIHAPNVLRHVSHALLCVVVIIEAGTQCLPSSVAPCAVKLPGPVSL